LAEYCSCETNYLILPDETYDPATGKVKEPGRYHQPIEPIPDNFLSDDALGDLDEASF
jgi:hypothetical protein